MLGFGKKTGVEIEPGSATQSDNESFGEISCTVRAAWRCRTSVEAALHVQELRGGSMTNRASQNFQLLYTCTIICKVFNVVIDEMLSNILISVGN